MDKGAYALEVFFVQSLSLKMPIVWNFISISLENIFHIVKNEIIAVLKFSRQQISKQKWLLMTIMLGRVKTNDFNTISNVQSNLFNRN